MKFAHPELAEVVRTAMDRDIGGVHCRTEHGPNYWRAISMTSLHDLGHNTTPIALESNVAGYQKKQTAKAACAARPDKDFVSNLYRARSAAYIRELESRVEVVKPRSEADHVRGAIPTDQTRTPSAGRLQLSLKGV